jgi:hypothetical protein
MKLALYQQFYTVLIIAAVCSTCVMFLETYAHQQTMFVNVCVVLPIDSHALHDCHSAQRYFMPAEALWSSEWLKTGFWHLLYFSVLTAIAILWRPTENNTRYAYVESEDAEIMLEEVHTVEGVTQRRTKEEDQEAAEAQAATEVELYVSTTFLLSFVLPTTAVLQ